MTAVRLVLDASAVIAYASTVDVGETIGEVQDGGVRFAVPVVSLAEAAMQVDADLIVSLLGSKSAQVEPVEVGDWPMLAAAMSVLGTLEAACALLLCDRYDCDILTAHPGRYRGLGDSPPIIPIG